MRDPRSLRVLADQRVRKRTPVQLAVVPLDPKGEEKPLPLPEKSAPSLPALVVLAALLGCGIGLVMGIVAGASLMLSWVR